MTLSDLTRNWKTSLTGIVAFLLGVPAIVSALSAWSHHQPVDWRQTLVAVALAVAGIGLGAAKDSTTHSTLAEVQEAEDKSK